MNITNIVAIINFNKTTLKTLTEAWKCRIMIIDVLGVITFMLVACLGPSPLFQLSQGIRRLRYKSPVEEQTICCESNEAIRVVEIGEQLPLKAPEEPWKLFPHSLGEYIWRFAKMQYRLKWYWRATGHILPGMLWRLDGENDFFQKDRMCWLEGGWRKKALKSFQVSPGSKQRLSPIPCTAHQIHTCGWMLLICSWKVVDAGTPEKDRNGIVITKTTLDSSEGSGSGVRQRAGPWESVNMSKQFCHHKSKPKAKHNGELEADSVCQWDLICFSTETVARASIPDWRGQQSGGSLEGWSYSFQIGVW